MPGGKDDFFSVKLCGPLCTSVSVLFLTQSFAEEHRVSQRKRKNLPIRIWALSISQTAQLGNPYVIDNEDIKKRFYKHAQFLEDGQS